MPENIPILEKDLEKALIKKLEKFLLELGRGFMFVGSQQRITLGNNLIMWILFSIIKY